MAVEVVSDSLDIEYLLDKNDVITLFQNFGRVKNVTIETNLSKATVVMEDPKDGYRALEKLNFYALTESGTYLIVKWQFDNFEDLQKSVQSQCESSK